MHHSLLLLQLIVILVCSRIVGWLLKRIGQPMVVGEMIAGMLLGPIVFGAVSPGLHAWMFPRESIAELDALSQVGLVLFMLIVGAEIRVPSGNRVVAKAAISIGTLSVVIPIALGIAIAMPLRAFAPAGTAQATFALFMGVSISITALPVMARVLKERGETHTAVARAALLGAAVADAIGWVLLGLVVLLSSHHMGTGPLWRTLLGMAMLGLILYGLVRPLSKGLLSKYAVDGVPAGAVLTALLIGALACAYVTSALDLHPFFGAFLFGLALPRDDRLLHSLIERIEHLSVLLLMPVFFALSGLNTTPEAFSGAGIAGLLLILVSGTLGKILGGGFGARLVGQTWTESLAIGSLMNARGLMELIVMKIGLDGGIIGGAVFTMLLVMAIATTMMTGPLLDLILGTRGARGALKKSIGYGKQNFTN